MMMVELTSVPMTALPVSVLSDHLRLSSGFADDGSQDATLEACLRSAMAAIEARIGKALLARQFALTLTEWHSSTSHGLPIAPVSQIASVTVIARGGEETVVDAARYDLLADAHRPRLEAVVGQLPTLAKGSSAEVVMLAGYGSNWADLPADLKQAMLGLAAEFFNLEAATPQPMPAHVLALIEPYRQIRLRGSAA